jgi:hypothetical protein
MNGILLFLQFHRGTSNHLYRLKQCLPLQRRLIQFSLNKKGIFLSVNAAAFWSIYLQSNLDAGLILNRDRVSPSELLQLVPQPYQARRLSRQRDGQHIHQTVEFRQRPVQLGGRSRNVSLSVCRHCAEGDALLGQSLHETFQAGDGLVRNLHRHRITRQHIIQAAVEISQITSMALP